MTAQPLSILSLLRLCLALFICLFAWHHMETWYLGAMAFLLVTYVSSKLFPRNVSAENPLPLAADIATFLATAIGCWLLFPHLIIQERIFVLVVTVSCVARLFTANNNRRASQHWLATFTTALLIVAILIALITNNTWMFRAAVIIQMLYVVYCFPQNNKA